MSNLTDREMQEMADLLAEARPALEEMSLYLATRNWRGHLTLPLGGGHVAIVMRDEDARRVREEILG